MVIYIILYIYICIIYIYVLYIYIYVLYIYIYRIIYICIILIYIYVLYIYVLYIYMYYIYICIIYICIIYICIIYIYVLYRYMNYIYPLSSVELQPPLNELSWPPTTPLESSCSPNRQSNHATRCWRQWSLEINGDLWKRQTQQVQLRLQLMTKKSFLRYGMSHFFLET